ncbi:MAG: ParB N-terminal domain-containing protein [Deltaproteobacteria bacterium]|nr:ParB N-terminal domain-containing protein [Deltaproteobacteria bacterium]
MPVTSDCQFLHLDPAALNLEDMTFNLRPFYEEPGTDLIESVRQFGVLCPPLVQEQPAGGFFVVSGKKRIRAALRRAATGKIPCLVAPHEIQAFSLFSLLLHHALIGGQLSVIEQANFFRKALKRLPWDRALPLLIPLGYKAQKYKIEELLNFLALDPSVIAGLHQGTIRPKSAQKMRQLAPADQQELARLIAELQLGGSKQHKLIDLGIDLMMRHERSMREIIARYRLENEEKNQENKPQEAASFLRWLFEECHPGSVAAEAEFKRFAAGLEVPPKINVGHTRSFEDDTVVLSLSFADRESLLKVWPEIRTIMATATPGE